MIRITIGFHGRGHGPGHPEGCPGPGSTLYALASLRTLAAEVLRELLRLLARLVVDHELAYRYPAISAGVGALVLVVGCCVEGISDWRYSVLVHRTSLLWAR